MTDPFEKLRDHEGSMAPESAQWDALSGRLNRRRRRIVGMWFFVGLVGLFGVGSALYWTSITSQPGQLSSSSPVQTDVDGSNLAEEHSNSGHETVTSHPGSNDEKVTNRNQGKSSLNESDNSKSNLSGAIVMASGGSDNSNHPKQSVGENKQAHNLTIQTQITAKPSDKEDQSASSQEKVEISLNDLLHGPFSTQMPNGLFLIGYKSQLKNRALLITQTPPIKVKPTREISLWTGLGVGVLGDLQKSSNAQLASGFLAFHYDFRPPFGVAVRAGLTSEFDHQLEYVYTYSEVFLTRREVTATYSALNVNYVHMAPMITSAINEKHSLGVGGFYNRIYQARGEKANSNIALESSAKGWGYHGLLNPAEYGISAQYDYAITEQVKLGVNLQYGLSNRLNATYFPNGASAYRRDLRLTLQKRIR